MTATLTTLDMDKVEKSEELFVATMLIASNKETKLTDSIVQEWADEGFPVVASTERFVKLYVGDNSFIKDIQRRVNRGGKITLRQARAVLNITVQTFNKVTPERVNTYRCFNCKTATFATASAGPGKTVTLTGATLAGGEIGRASCRERVSSTG